MLRSSTDGQYMHARGQEGTPKSAQAIREVHPQESMEEGCPADTPRQDKHERAIHTRHRGLQGPHGHLLSVTAPSSKVAQQQ